MMDIIETVELVLVPLIQEQTDEAVKVSSRDRVSERIGEQIEVVQVPQTTEGDEVGT